jgi:MFS family permease
MLLGARMIMGIAEGPVLLIAQSIMVAESSKHRRGFNMGVIQTFGRIASGVPNQSVLWSVNSVERFESRPPWDPRNPVLPGGMPMSVASSTMRYVASRLASSNS